MKFRKLFDKIFSGKKEDILTPAGEAPPVRPEGRPIPIRMRRYRTQRAPRFPDIRMQRGVQMAMERKQRPARLAFIYETMRQGVEMAKERRAAYLKRRVKRWRGVVEGNLPRMFARAMEEQGMAMEVGSGERFKGEFSNKGLIPVQQ